MINYELMEFVLNIYLIDLLYIWVYIWLQSNILKIPLHVLKLCLQIRFVLF